MMRIEVTSFNPDAIRRLAERAALVTADARRDWHATLATVQRGVVQEHARATWPQRHRTAARLGAQPTGWLERGIQMISARSDESTATVDLTGNAATAAQRVDGPVTIVPRGKKWLTIPATAEAYGRRPGEFSQLRVLFFGRGRIALGVGPGKGEQGPRKVFFWLRKSVTLPQDRTLLPPDEVLRAGVDAAAEEFLEARQLAGSLS